MKKTISGVINFVSIAVIILAVLILISVILTAPGEVPDIGGYSMLRVLTGSMEPELPTDCVIIIHKVDPEQVAVGDILSFYSPDPALRGAINTHRVVQIDRENGDMRFVTKGDANMVVDAYPPAPHQIIGVVVGSSLLLGKTIRLLSNPLVFLPLVLLPLVVLILLNLFKAIKTTRELMRQEEEAAIREALEEARKRQQEIENRQKKTETE